MWWESLQTLTPQSGSQWCGYKMASDSSTTEDELQQTEVSFSLCGQCQPKGTPDHALPGG